MDNCLTPIRPQTNTFLNCLHVYGNFSTFSEYTTSNITVKSSAIELLLNILHKRVDNITSPGITTTWVQPMQFPHEWLWHSFQKIKPICLKIIKKTNISNTCISQIMREDYLQKYKIEWFKWPFMEWMNTSSLYELMRVNSCLLCSVLERWHS